MKSPIRVFRRMQKMQRIQMCFARAAATAATRIIDPTKPISWEFSGFSQNGEDGIVDYLIQQLKEKNKYFIEIGSSDGIVNSTAWLALAKNYSGIMIEGDAVASQWSNEVTSMLSIGVESVSMFVDLENIQILSKMATYQNPDFFSLDIDGNDYYIAAALMDAGIRPKIFSVEYNSAYGPEKSMTITYKPSFNFFEAHETHIYYGVSIAAWKKFFEKQGYRFVTVDSNGVNAFFCDPDCFEPKFLDSLKGLAFQENFYQMKKFKKVWEKQFKMISTCDFTQV